MTGDDTPLDGLDERFGERFDAWLRDVAGVDEPRRIVRVDASTILVSKFEEGFAPRLMATVDELRELFDLAAVPQRYRMVGIASPSAPRVDTWSRAVVSLLHAAQDRGRISAGQRAEVEAGVDSVAALLSAILWTSPPVAGAYTPHESERAAYLETLARMDAESSLFTRYYGTFDGRRVVNHCPGARIARRLLAQAWRICTGTEPPSPESPG